MVGRIRSGVEGAVRTGDIGGAAMLITLGGLSRRIDIRLRSVEVPLQSEGICYAVSYQLSTLCPTWNLIALTFILHLTCVFAPHRLHVSPGLVSPQIEDPQ